MILLIIVSFISVPILKTSSPTVISQCKNLPYKDSLETKISFRPSFESFFAVKKFIFSPNFTTTLLFFASITSSEKFLAL